MDSGRQMFYCGGMQIRTIHCGKFRDGCRGDVRCGCACRGCTTAVRSEIAKRLEALEAKAKDYLTRDELEQLRPEKG
jgi:hypothetical protein